VDSQTPRPAFEVASIKENTGAAGPPIWVPQRSGDRVTLRKVRLDVVINYAWHIDNLYEISFTASMRIPGTTLKLRAMACRMTIGCD